ncbi:hypothetical protein CQA66_00885 [Helicobacter aurati]|uniref:Periplasmic protein n=1 Tax=Helicobacter aurati TaxID=137778 RepID=A0A3D8J8M1_9HELI|nr:hypothetical protein [Helicobacter aurati]RDU73772.1 hypothetical protein CQA66_00885 [Helicobacter aurati]
MKKLFVLFIFNVLSAFVLADCTSLMNKYQAPDPASKTMMQITRWLKKVEDSNDAKILEKCMIAKAADNPNKSQVAGK